MQICHRRPPEVFVHQVYAPLSPHIHTYSHLAVSRGLRGGRDSWVSLVIRTAATNESHRSVKLGYIVLPGSNPFVV